eukprot:GHVU01083221.1.p1 GENE.GHVU01083221.1~~GHVU01083221.1.p1  ORF type:complete len:277 (+),score=13.27 GHVU01083221.1:1221-2051(+)
MSCMHTQILCAYMYTACIDLSHHHFLRCRATDQFNASAAVAVSRVPTAAKAMRLPQEEGLILRNPWNIPRQPVPRTPVVSWPFVDYYGWRCTVHARICDCHSTYTHTHAHRRTHTHSRTHSVAEALGHIVGVDSLTHSLSHRRCTCGSEPFRPAGTGNTHTVKAQLPVIRHWLVIVVCGVSSSSSPSISSSFSSFFYLPPPLHPPPPSPLPPPLSPPPHTPHPDPSSTFLLRLSLLFFIPLLLILLFIVPSFCAPPQFHRPATPQTSAPAWSGTRR